MFFKKSAKKMSSLGRPEDPNWIRSKHGKFFRLLGLRPDEEGLEGKSGVYIIWHGGVRPGWVFVGQSRNLAKDLKWCADSNEIQHFERFGGLYVSWCLVRDEFQAGIARYLIQMAKPQVPNTLSPGAGADPIPVILPGTKAD